MGNVSTTHTEKVYRRYNNTKGYGNKSEKSTEGIWAGEIHWFQWLCQDDYFMDLVVKRWKELLPVTINLVEETELGISRIDYLLAAYQPAFERNYLPKEQGGAGWTVNKQALKIDYDKPPETYAENVELLRQWLIERIAWLDAEFSKMLPGTSE